jgi:hypothetical protein
LLQGEFIVIAVPADIIRSEPIVLVGNGKVFQLATRRNEWVDWQGSTMLVNRSGKKFFFKLIDAKRAAAMQRNQGTRLEIRDVPIIYARSQSGMFFACELFANKPMWGYLNSRYPRNRITTIGGLERILPKEEWAVTLIQSGYNNVCAEDGYFKYVWQRRLLRWSSEDLQVDDKAVRQIVVDVQRSITR